VNLAASGLRSTHNEVYFTFKDHLQVATWTAETGLTMAIPFENKQRTTVVLVQPSHKLVRFVHVSQELFIDDTLAHRFEQGGDLTHPWLVGGDNYVGLLMNECDFRLWQLAPNPHEVLAVRVEKLHDAKLIGESFVICQERDETFVLEFYGCTNWQLFKTLKFPQKSDVSFVGEKWILVVAPGKEQHIMWRVE